MNQNIDHFIPFARPYIGTEEEEAVVSVLRSGWLTTGKETLAFEREFASFLSVPFAKAVNSATAGLHLSLEAIGISEGDLVATTPYTFTATAEIARYLGAHPLFIDIQEKTLNIDPVLVERALKNDPQRIKAILPVHIAGHPCDMEKLCSLSDSYNIPIIEDASHAFPARTEDGFLGTVGEVGVFSLYATKPITTGEGGMLVTRNQRIADRVSTMRLHGIDREIWGRYQSSNSSANSWEYDIIAPGYKYNLGDLASTIGRIQLSKAVEMHERRAKQAAYYRKRFDDADFLTLPTPHPRHAWHLFIIHIVENRLTITRDRFISLLRERGIGTSVHYRPLHMMSYYKNTYSLHEEDFPVATTKYRTAISIPLYPGLTEEELCYIADTVLAIGKSHRRRS